MRFTRNNDDSGYIPTTFADLNNKTGDLPELSFHRSTPCTDSQVVILSASDIKEIESCVNLFEGSRLPLSSLTPSTFPLPNLGSRLREVSKEIHGDTGFMLFRGIDPFKYTRVQNIMIHAGLACHVGEKRAMPGAAGGDNAVLHHITDISPSASSEYHGPPNTLGEIPFHTDLGDIVSLYTLARSQTGGSFYLAKAADVYEKIMTFCPELAQTLLNDWILVDPSTGGASIPRPLVFESNGQVVVNCSRALITGTASRPRPADIPAITQTQQQAIDALHYFGRACAVKLNFEPGDLLFFNNLSMLHARDGFTDDQSQGRKRHILRIILRDESFAWDVPACLRQTLDGLYDHEPTDEAFPAKEELFSYAVSH